MCVDDILLIGDKESVQCAINDIESKFDIRKEGPFEDYLGCIVKIDGDKECIHQPHSLKKIEDKLVRIVNDIRIGHYHVLLD